MVSNNLNENKKHHTNQITRRQALKVFGAISAMFACPAIAYGRPSINDKINAAKLDANQAKATLDSLSDEVAQKNAEVASIQSEIDEIEGEISEIETQITKKEKELDKRKDVLASRISQDYKQGGDKFLSILMSSTTIEELTSNMYYFTKVSEHDKELIAEIKAIKDELDKKRQKLASEKDDLKKQKAEKDEQLAQVEAKQAEAQKLFDGLNKDVRDLVQKRDEELAAAIAEQKKYEEQNKGSSSGGSVDTSAGSGSLSRIISACHSTPSPGGGLCAMWVSLVFSRAGYGYPGGNACDMYRAWCHSSNRAHLKPGMIVACSSHPHTRAGRIYGHVGIYQGGGIVMDNVGYVRTIGLDSWISYYGATVPVRWGWIGGRALS